MPYVNNKDADQPVHPRSLISAFVVRCLDSISKVAVFKIPRFLLAFKVEQAVYLRCNVHLMFLLFPEVHPIISQW